jgi:hypothetical protein
MKRLIDHSKIFGFSTDQDEERSRFVQRINLTIFRQIRKLPRYEDVFREACYVLGLNADDWIVRENKPRTVGPLRIPPPRRLTHDDFWKVLELILVFYEVIPSLRKAIDDAVLLAFGHSMNDLGILWKDGAFYPQGAKELDDILIADNLEWLAKYPQAKDFFASSLRHFSRSLEDTSARRDAMTNAYSSLEALAQSVLGNQRSLEKNSDGLLHHVSFASEYGNILYQYKQLGHSYSSRHAGEVLSHEETEVFIYLTGLFLRLFSRKTSDK